VNSIIFPQHSFGPRKQPVHHELGDSLGQVEDEVEPVNMTVTFNGDGNGTWRTWVGLRHRHHIRSI